MNNDFRLNTRSKDYQITSSENAAEDWNILFADTGKETNTGGRIKKIEKYIETDIFFATYGDGISDVDINALLAYHRRHGKLATMTGFHPHSKYGQIQMGDNGNVIAFKEKPQLKDLINGGFFVFDRQFFRYLDEECILEREPFERAAADKQMVLYKHEGFWFAVDTYKDYLEINDMVQQGRTPWKIWE